MSENIRILNTESKMVAPETLTLHDRNANEGDIGAIVESFVSNGFWGRVIVDTRTGEVLAGNHRVMAAVQLMMPQIPVEYVTTDNAEHALRILAADNRINRLGRDDENKLAELLAELSNTETGLAGTGFSGDDLDQLISDLAGTAPEIEASAQDVQNVGEQFVIIIECEGESQQSELLERFIEEGISCKALTS